MPDVLDASAALAWVKGEAGGSLVQPLLRGALMCSVNFSEVLQKTLDDGVDPVEMADLLERRGVIVTPATRGDAMLAARFWERGTSLSLADRFCLALAYRMDGRAVTADRAWRATDTGAEILVIR